MENFLRKCRKFIGKFFCKMNKLKNCLKIYFKSNKLYGWLMSLFSENIKKKIMKKLILM